MKITVQPSYNIYIYTCVLIQIYICLKLKRIPFVGDNMYNNTVNDFSVN